MIEFGKNKIATSVSGKNEFDEYGIKTVFRHEEFDNYGITVIRSLIQLPSDLRFVLSYSREQKGIYVNMFPGCDVGNWWVSGLVGEGLQEALGNPPIGEGSNNKLAQHNRTRISLTLPNLLVSRFLQRVWKGDRFMTEEQHKTTPINPYLANEFLTLPLKEVHGTHPVRPGNIKLYLLN